MFIDLVDKVHCFVVESKSGIHRKALVAHRILAKVEHRKNRIDRHGVHENCIRF